MDWAKPAPNEQSRLDALKAYGILDTPPEAEFDRITRMVASICETPMATMTLVDGRRQWFKSTVGLDIRETDRAIAFCAHAICGTRLFTVPDTLKNPLFRNNPLVTGSPGLRFYAGMPLVNSNGLALGALAVMDRVPRRLNPRQEDALEILADQVVMRLDLRLMRRPFEQTSAGDVNAPSTAHHANLWRLVGHAARIGTWECALADRRVKWSDEVDEIRGLQHGPRPSGDDAIDLFAPESRDRIRSAIGACLDHGTVFDKEAQIIAASGRRVWVRMAGEPMRNACGAIVGAQGILMDITEKRRAETAVDQNQKHLRQLTDAMSQIVWTARPDGTLDYMNRATTAYTGVADAELAVRHWISGIHPDDTDRCTRSWCMAVETGSPFSIELRIWSVSDGAYRWHHVRAIPTRDEEHAIIKWYGNAIDIHDSKTAETRIRELADGLAEALESMTDGMYLLDRDWRITYLNGEAERLLQRPRALLLGSIVWEVYREPAGSIFQCEFHKAFQENRAVEFEAYDAPFDRWLEVRAYPSDRNLAVYFRDISERKRAQEAIYESEQRFQSVAKVTADAIWDWDLRSDSVWWSDGMQTSFGYPVEEIEPGIESWTGRIHPDDKERVLRDTQSAINGSGESRTGEYRFLRKDGSYAYIWDRGFVVRTAEGEPVRMVGGMTDLTAHRQAELDTARLNRALRMRSACNELLIRASDETELLNGVCRLTLDIGGYWTAWVGYAHDDDAKSIRFPAYAGIPEVGDYLSGSRHSWSENDAIGRGPAGKTIRSGMPTIIDDLTREPSMAPWLSSIRRYGFRGGVYLPLRDRERTFGLLAMYSSEVLTASADEIKLLQDLADDLAFGICNIRSQEERRRLQAAVLKVAAGVSASSGKEIFEHLARNMAEAVGAQGGFVARLLPGGQAAARMVAAVVDGVLQENFDYGFNCSHCLGLLQDGRLVVPTDAAACFSGSALLASFGAQAYVGVRLDNSAGQPVGLLFVLFREPLTRADFILSMLQIFAARAAAELEREDADLRIRNQASLLDKAQDAIVVRGMDDRILFWNKSAERLYGWKAEEALGHSKDELLYEDSATFAQASSLVLAQGEWSGEAVQRRKDGSTLIVESRWTLVTDDHGRPQSILSINTDITQRKAVEQQVHNLAFYDPLTRLPNRSLLVDRLQHALSLSARNHHVGALLFIDLDNFKTLNDTLGHEKGDLLLQQVAGRLRTCVRDSDTVARLGGDEFVVMLECVGEHQQDAAAHAKAVCEKILDAFTLPYHLAGHAYHSTPSIGATLFIGDQHDVDELLKRADLAMYQAKASGRNTMRFFDPQMQTAVTARVALEADLRAGLQRGEFVLHYQPQVDSQGCVVGAEALVRWVHAERGTVAPEEFVPLAEETALILPLGQWVLESACLQLAAWGADPDKAHLTMAVNVSIRQFRYPGFVEQVLNVLRKTGANPYNLKLELTETLLVENVDDTIAKMTTLKASGVGFSLDDFGTGYSSLYYLKRLPLDQLKIDQSFVRDVTNDPNDAAIVRTIIALGQSLGLAVIAEGVETEDERDFLIFSGCHTYQGYLFSRPLPIGAFESYLDRQSRAGA